MSILRLGRGRDGVLRRVPASTLRRTEVSDNYVNGRQLLPNNAFPLLATHSPGWAAENQVWANDLWISATENWQPIREAGVFVRMIARRREAP